MPIKIKPLKKRLKEMPKISTWPKKKDGKRKSRVDAKSFSARKAKLMKYNLRKFKSQRKSNLRIPAMILSTMVLTH